MICKACGCENESGSKFCKKCGSALSETTNQQTTTEEATNVETGNVATGNTTGGGVNKSSFESVKQDKKKMILIASIILIIGCFLGYKNYNANNVKKSIVKQDLIGREIYIGNLSVNITEDNIKKVNISEQNSFVDEIVPGRGIKFCDVTGTVVIENNMYKIEAPFKSNYIYSKNPEMGKVGWIHDGARINSKEDEILVEIKQKATEETFKANIVGQTIQGIEITEEMAKNLKIDNMEEKYKGTTVIADISMGYEGKLLSKQTKFQATANIEEDEWVFTNPRNSKNVVSAKEGAIEISVDEFKKDLANICEKDDIDVEFNKRYSDLGNIDIKDIIEVKDVKVEKEMYGGKSTYTITSTVKAKRNKATFDGELTVEVNENSNYGYFELVAENATIEKPTNEEIVGLLKDKTITYYVEDSYFSKSSKLTDENIKTLKIIEAVQFADNPSEFAVFGTMSHSSLVDDNVTIIVRYNPKDNKFGYREIGSMTNEYFARNYSKEAVAEANAKAVEN